MNEWTSIAIIKELKIPGLKVQIANLHQPGKEVCYKIITFSKSLNLIMLVFSTLLSTNISLSPVIKKSAFESIANEIR